MNKALFLVCISGISITTINTGDKVSSSLKKSLSRKASSSFVDIELQGYNRSVKVAEAEFLGTYNVLASIERYYNENIHVEISKLPPQELSLQLTWLRGVQMRYTKHKEGIQKRDIVIVTEWKQNNEHEIIRGVRDIINTDEPGDESDIFKTELTVSLYNTPAKVAPQDPDRPEFQVILNHSGCSWTCFGDGYQPHVLE